MTALCHRYQRGTCTFGVGCKYLHVQLEVLPVKTLQNAKQDMERRIVSSPDKPVYGLDIGGVLDQHGRRGKPLPNQADAVKALVSQVEPDNVKVVSVARPHQREASLRNLQIFESEHQTGIDLHNVYYCDRWEEKVELAKILHLNVFIDDRADVLLMMSRLPEIKTVICFGRPEERRDKRVLQWIQNEQRAELIETSADEGWSTVMNFLSRDARLQGQPAPYVREQPMRRQTRFQEDLGLFGAQMDAIAPMQYKKVDYQLTILLRLTAPEKNIWVHVGGWVNVDDAAHQIKCSQGDIFAVVRRLTRASARTHRLHVCIMRRLKSPRTNGVHHVAYRLR